MRKSRKLFFLILFTGLLGIVSCKRSIEGEWQNKENDEHLSVAPNVVASTWPGYWVYYDVLSFTDSSLLLKSMFCGDTVWMAYAIHDDNLSTRVISGTFDRFDSISDFTIDLSGEKVMKWVDNKIDRDKLPGFWQESGDYKVLVIDSLERCKFKWAMHTEHYFPRWDGRFYVKGNNFYTLSSYDCKKGFHWQILYLDDTMLMVRPLTVFIKDTIVFTRKTPRKDIDYHNTISKLYFEEDL